MFQDLIKNGIAAESIPQLIDLSSVATSFTIPSQGSNGYTAVKDCFIDLTYDVSYNNSGWLKIQVNGEYIFQTTDRGTYHFLLYANAGDSFTFYGESMGYGTAKVIYYE